jgi:hypothetical protein
MGSYVEWLDEAQAKVAGAAGSYMDTPGPDRARDLVSAALGALSIHYERLGPRLLSDETFASRTRMYGTEVRGVVMRFATLAMKEGRKAGDREGAALLSAWVRDDLLPAKSESEYLRRELDRPKRAGSAAGSSGAAEAPLPDNPEGWVRIDDERAFGSRWREILDWPPQGTPGWDLLDGDYGLFVRREGGTDRTDALAAPVFLASGVWVTSRGKDLLEAAVDGDVACARDPAASASDLCRTSTVMTLFAEPICNHYDGRGNVFLAECDCIKQLQLPSVMRIRSLCDSSASQPTSGVTARGCEDMVKAEDVGNPQTSLRAWPTRNLAAIKSPLLANSLYRYAVRSQRRLSGMQGTFASCTFPPCGSLRSSSAYTDARVTAMEQARCPPVRCEASINVDWVGGNVLIDGNMLRVQCFGGLCMRSDGQPKCRSGGRCLADGACNCQGTGFKGDTCEEEDKDAPATSNAVSQDLTVRTPSIAGPIKDSNSIFDLAHLFADSTIIIIALGSALVLVSLVYGARGLLRRRGYV